MKKLINKYCKQKKKLYNYGMKDVQCIFCLLVDQSWD